MKFILSRKGFDSSWGGHACPAIPGRELLMLPIPSVDPRYSQADKLTYAQLRVPGGGGTFIDVMQSHGMKHLVAGDEKRELTPDVRCHLDPDLTPAVIDRPPNWRAAFGQSEAAEGHLRRQSVGSGDIFLFFGLFRDSDGTQFKEGSKFRHILFGYLQVGEVFRTDENGYHPPPWSHPHFDGGYTHHKGKDTSKDEGRQKNAVYAASEKLTINGKALGVPGHGTFRYAEKRVLTRQKASSHTEWNLPSVFRHEGVNLSYHKVGGTYGWKDVGNGESYFQSAHRGQEFVFEATPSAIDWFTKTLLPE